MRLIAALTIRLRAKSARVFSSERIRRSNKKLKKKNTAPPAAIYQSLGNTAKYQIRIPRLVAQKTQTLAFTIANNAKNPITAAATKKGENKNPCSYGWDRQV